MNFIKKTLMERRITQVVDYETTDEENIEIEQKHGYWKVSVDGGIEVIFCESSDGRSLVVDSPTAVFGYWLLGYCSVEVTIRKTFVRVTFDGGEIEVKRR